MLKKWVEDISSAGVLQKGVIWWDMPLRKGSGGARPSDTDLQLFILKFTASSFVPLRPLLWSSHLGSISLQAMVHRPMSNRTTAPYLSFSVEYILGCL